MKYASLFWRYMQINAHTLLEYRADFILTLASQVVELLIALLFWGVIFSHVTNLNGWTFGQIIVLIGFFRIGLGIFWMFLDGTEHLDDLILYGDLDKYLARPISPLIGHLFSHMGLFALDLIIIGAVYLMIGGALGAAIAFWNLLAALLFIFIGLLILGCIMVAIGSLSFWVGRTGAIWTIWNVIWNVGDYPATIFPGLVQFAFTLVIPVFFLQTYPAIIALNQMAGTQFFNLILTELALLAFWFAVMEIIWRRGVKRYGSYGG